MESLGRRMESGGFLANLLFMAEENNPDLGADELRLVAEKIREECVKEEEELKSSLLLIPFTAVDERDEELLELRVRLGAFKQLLREYGFI